MSSSSPELSDEETRRGNDRDRPPRDANGGRPNGPDGQGMGGPGQTPPVDTTTTAPTLPVSSPVTTVAGQATPTVTTTTAGGTPWEAMTAAMRQMNHNLELMNTNLGRSIHAQKDDVRGIMDFLVNSMTNLTVQLSSMAPLIDTDQARGNVGPGGARADPPANTGLGPAGNDGPTRPGPPGMVIPNPEANRNQDQRQHEAPGQRGHVPGRVPNAVPPN
jgi:hypothetical protein